MPVAHPPQHTCWMVEVGCPAAALPFNPPAVANQLSETAVAEGGSGG